MSGPAPTALVYAGAANTWECDEMGHLNVRFYAARFMEGLGRLAAIGGVAGAFRRDARATLVLEDQHIRFLKEARPGQGLTMVGGVAEVTDTHATFYQELRHLDGAPAATAITRVRHAAPGDLHGFPWSNRSREALTALACAIPEHGAPRSIPLTPPQPPMTVAELEALGVGPIGAGMVSPDECDAIGRMRPELVLGRISDAVPNLLAPWREAVAQAASTADGAVKEAGAAVLEYRLLYWDWPVAGDLIEVRSAVTEVAAKTHRVTHCLLDPVTGRPWSTSQAVAVTFDLKTRKVIPAPPAQRDALKAMAVKGVRF